MKTSGIYIIKNKISFKVYIGQSNDVKYRWRKHKYELKNNIHFNSHLQHSYNKYGFECFEFEVIEECDQDIIDERECYHISQHKATNREHGYNLDSGGNNNKKHSEETKRKIKESNLGKKRSLKTRERNRQANLGKVLTEDHKKKISINNGKSMLGKAHSNETKGKISASKLKYPLTQNMIDDIHGGIKKREFQEKYGTLSPYGQYRRDNKDKNLPMNYGCSMRGRTLSEESKKKISESKTKHHITEEMILDIESGMTRTKFGTKYGTERPWRKYREKNK